MASQLAIPKGIIKAGSALQIPIQNRATSIQSFNAIQSQRRFRHNAFASGNDSNFLHRKERASASRRIMAWYSSLAVNMTSDFWLGETKESWVPTRHSLNVMLYIAPSNLQHALPMAHVREHISRWWKQFTNHEPRRGKSTVESNQYLLSPTGKKGFDVIVATVFDVF
jgi:hypothetical protein